MTDLQFDIDADSGTDDDEYDDPEPNQVNTNPSNNDKQESEPELIPVQPRKTPEQNRLVHSIDSAFDKLNFTQIELPAENKTYGVEIETKKKDQAAKIFESDRCPYLKEKNTAEIYAFIGLMYATGLQGQNSVRTELLFLEN